jgi:hypothetical protein
MSTQEIGETENKNGFAVATRENLDHLVEGCYVLVGTGATASWVEICHIDGDRFNGIVHPELSADVCPIHHDYCEIASFRRDEITALGCDRYCWC